VARPKPAPDVCLLAVNRLRRGPAGVIAIDNSATGVPSTAAPSTTAQLPAGSALPGAGAHLLE